nr:hypothetical protein [Rhodococcus wratislaviensis]GLK33751.1 hypothetical protein GCM10017611_05940 [Rhodococcus wratislaviensis]
MTSSTGSALDTTLIRLGAEDRRVVEACPVRPTYAMALVPDDVEFAQQWFLGESPGVAER